MWIKSNLNSIFKCKYVLNEKIDNANWIPLYHELLLRNVAYWLNNFDTVSCSGFTQLERNESITRFWLLGLIFVASVSSKCFWSRRLDNFYRLSMCLAVYHETRSTKESYSFKPGRWCKRYNVVKSTNASGRANTWMGSRVEYPFASHYTCQVVQSGFRKSFSWHSIVLQNRHKIDISSTWCSMLMGVKDTTQGLKV